MKSFTITGRLVDILNQNIYVANVEVENGKIKAINSVSGSNQDTLPYIIPGFIDAHVHIESSMLVPSEFAKLAVVHGTVGTVSDPHEIANVCGIEGVEFMIRNGKTVPFKFNFGAPSCVPATIFETAGASIDANGVAALLEKDEIRYLSEMMNFPGVLYRDEEVMKKIQAATRLSKPVDGHAPGLRGDNAKQYIEAGAGKGKVTISTDHECFTREEALDKLAHGMKILIREGSAARNFDALIELLNDYPDKIMFCSDDKHPDSLVEGHINQLCARARSKGIDVYNVLRAACVNPVEHYKLDIGLLRVNDPADLVVVKDLENFEVIRTFVNGELVAEEGKSLISTTEVSVINNFNCSKKEVDDFVISNEERRSLVDSDGKFLVIEALEGQLITKKLSVDIDSKNPGGDIERDILKIVVVNRYAEAPIAKALIKNFGLKQGAIASSVAHDSHNIVAIGVDDESICKAVNMVIEHNGGVSCVKDNLDMIVPLPVAGLMSDRDGYKIAEQYSLIDRAAKEAGCKLNAPFMTLSFMALLVIPHLKLSDKGLFDGDEFKLR